MIIVAVGFALILIPVVTAIRDLLSYTNHMYVLTNRRVIQLSGVLDKVVTDTSLEKVNDVKLTQSALGRMFDYGDIEILTASELGTNLFKRIDHPVEFKTAMLNAKEKLESGEGFTFGDIAVAGGREPAGPDHAARHPAPAGAADRRGVPGEEDAVAEPAISAHVLTLEYSNVFRTNRFKMTNFFHMKT